MMSFSVPMALAATVPRRMRGLLLGGRGQGALMLFPCKDVHTVGMTRPIDVAFVDGSGVVIEVHRNVGAFKRLRNRSAVAVVERIATCSSPWFRPGERVGLVPLAPASAARKPKREGNRR